MIRKVEIEKENNKYISRSINRDRKKSTPKLKNKTRSLKIKYRKTKAKIYHSKRLKLKAFWIIRLNSDNSNAYIKYD